MPSVTVTCMPIVVSENPAPGALDCWDTLQPLESRVVAVSRRSVVHCVAFMVQCLLWLP